MATRNHHAASAAQPANRGAARIAGKQNGAATSRPDAARRVLGDVGNVVSDVLNGKNTLPEGIHGPITMSFGAALVNDVLANNNTIAPAQPVAARTITNPATIVPAKNTNTPHGEKAPKVNRKPSDGVAGSSSSCSVQRNMRTKLVRTPSTILSDLFEAACGLTEKPKELIEDIDKFDGDDQFAVVDYVEDIYKFYMTAEHESRPNDYMGNQPEITSKTRASLVDRLIHSHQRFHLKPETLYLTIYIVDQYLSLQPVPSMELGLVGAAAMLIAWKYEEAWAEKEKIFIEIRPFDRHQILHMEKAILNSMNWELAVPTPYHFLLRFAKAASSDDEQLQHMVHFFGELALMDYGMMMTYASRVAACAVYAARLTLKKIPFWTQTLKHHTGLEEQQLIEGARILVSSHAAAPDAKLKAVYQKYAVEQFGKVALHPPAALSDLV